MRKFRKLFLILLIASQITSYGKEGSSDQDEEIQPLMLSNFLDRGQIKEGQTKATVQLEDFRNVLSYTGYFTVNQNYNSSIFFWFVPSRKNRETDPVLLWLQGGLGTSGLVGLFSEVGPFKFLNSYDIGLRKYAWTNRYSMIFVDSPVGSGFSYTENSRGYARTHNHVAKDLHRTLKQFFSVFPDYSNQEFYIVGESFAGKHVIALAARIHTKNKKSRHKINLKGLAIGSGFCDPKNQLHYGEYLYQIGLIDEKEKRRFEAMEHLALAEMEKEEYGKAFRIFDQMINGAFTPYTLYQNKTGLQSYYNYLTAKPTDDDLSLIATYIQLAEVRKSIHVGVSAFNVSSSTVEWNLRKDIMKSIVNMIPTLLKFYRILFWNGQLDVITAPALTETFLSKLKHMGEHNFRIQNRCLWKVEGQVAGYAKRAGNLTYVIVRNAGHLVAADQPHWALELIDKFITSIPYC